LKLGKTQAVTYDSKREEMVVPNCVNTPQIAFFPRLAKENTLPTRVLQGQKTLISRTMHGFAYDPIHDEIVVTSPLTQAILVFRGGADGEEPPIRVIQGPHTQILGTGYDGNPTVNIDPERNEIYLPNYTGAYRGAGDGTNGTNSLLVFAREANGDVAPKRVLKGMSAVAVDPVHDLLISKGGGGILIYDRTAVTNGNLTPKAVIKGPNSGIGGGGIQVYAQKGWIITGASDGFRSTNGLTGSIGVWSINDSGDVPPHYRIPVQKITGAGFSGLGIDPAHKELILPSGATNTVMTFYFPEIF
jgi:hypothetical protein